MNTFEATRQQLDPAATFDTYRATGVLVIFAIVWSVMTSLFIAGPAGGAVRGLSVLLIVTAGVWLLWAANPLRAPFTRRSMVIVYLFVLSAIVVASLEQLGRSIQGDASIPVAIGVGVLVVAIVIGAARGKPGWQR